MRILYERYKDPRQYNRPTANEVATLLIGEGSSENSNQDIILETISGSLQRISELHPSYMTLQYPPLFPYGEGGWHANILYNQPLGLSNLMCQ